MRALQAITTRVIGPTNSRGARVKATAAAGSVTTPWDYALSPRANHYAAAQALALEGAFPNGTSSLGLYAFGELPSGGYVLAYVTR